MAPKISLALAIHNHQPVGNFGWVVEDVYQHAYRPLIDALLRHSRVRLALHWSGPLLDWLPEAHPESIEALRTLVSRGQVEIMGGAYYEAILPSIPERDRHGQLLRMADEVERLFGRRPQGAWLAERVWEPDLPRSLAEAGYAWTIVDDNHFRAASLRTEALWRVHVTEHEGRLIRVFGTEQGLRYRIPFRPAEEVVEYLRQHATEAGDRLGVMGDDGEKFGAWPGTFTHCWGADGWMERFFGLLDENTRWLTTVTGSEWLAGRPPAGRVYLPTCSYLEMTEWALPADEAGEFVRLVERDEASGAPERRWLQGGFWRNFQVRYREVNELHKQMLRASAKVAAMPPGAERHLALDHLFQGQSNDCYWHGLFGGIYLVHLRLATYQHLIAAEDLADAVARRAAGEGGVPIPRDGGGAAAGAGQVRGAAGQDAADSANDTDLAGQADRDWPADAVPNGARLFDADLDSIPEAYLATEGQVVVVDLAEGAGIGSWDLRAPRLAVASVLRRRPEAYHGGLLRREATAAEATGEASATEAAVSNSVEAVPRELREPAAAPDAGQSIGEHLVYDQRERRSGLVHLVPGSTPARDLARNVSRELGDFADAAYTVEELDGRVLRVAHDGPVGINGDRLPLRVVKTLRLSGGRLDPQLRVEVELQNHAGHAVSLELALEFNSNVAGGGGNPAAFYRLADGSREGERLPHDSSGDRDRVESFGFGNEYEGVEVTVNVTPPARLTWFPVETVSNSESGFERVYQGSAWWLRWPVSVPPGSNTTCSVELAARCSRDRAVEDAIARDRA